MRILIVGETYYPAFNGQSTFMVNLAEGLARGGHAVTVVMPSHLTAAFRGERNGVTLEGLRSVPLSMARPDVFHSPFAAKAMRRIFREFQPEIVHIHDHYPLSRTAYRIARRGGVRVIGTNHFMPENLAPYLPLARSLAPAYDWVLWRWMLNLYNRLDVVAAPSRTAAAILQEAGLWAPVFPISCGIDLGRFRPDPGIDRAAMRQRYGLDPAARLFLFVGRVDGEKRLDVLLRAVSLLDRADIQLAVAGRGGGQARLQALVEDLGLGERVRFTGYVPDADLPGLLNSADVFAMPSEAELLSIATLEAMATGRPVLAARARALPELVSDGVNGYLFKPGEARDAARAMAQLADHPERWPGMAAASLERARPHSLENTLASYQNLYQLALAMPAAGQARPGARGLGRKPARNRPHQPVP